MFKECITVLFMCLLPGLSQKPDKCDTCREFAKNFNKGLDKTSRSNFGGGNTNWEEKNLGSYAGSETRLLEILEYACEESEKKECHYMVEENEELLENWWFHDYNKGSNRDLFVYLCDQTLKACCPNGTYGPSCQDCPAGRISPCSGHGQCKGSGYRTGKGTCSCDAGYEGESCDECSDRYFQEVGEDGKTNCTACHEACKSGCTSALASDCDDCKDGWTFQDDEGCFDIDECKLGTVSCTDKQYCSNLEGSHECKDCHRGCMGCTGPSNQECLACSTKHFLQGASCTPCHASCESTCTDESPNTCDACSEGWMDGEHGCEDKDECAEHTHSCTENQYCTNSPGSFHCLTCHNTCRGCTGPEKNHCLGCREGYRLEEDGTCGDVDECVSDDVCTDENERCANTIGSFACECIEGYVRRMGSPCFKKHTVPSSKKKKVKTTDKAQPPVDTEDQESLFNEQPGKDGFSKEYIEKLGRAAESKEQMIVMEGNVDKDALPKEDL